MKKVIKILCAAGMICGLSVCFSSSTALGQGVTTVCHVPTGDPTGATSLILMNPADITLHLGHGDVIGMCNFTTPGGGPGGPGSGTGPVGGPVSPPPSGDDPGPGPKGGVTVTSIPPSTPPEGGSDPVEVGTVGNPGRQLELNQILVLQDKKVWKDFASLLEVISQLDRENSEIEF